MDLGIWRLNNSRLNSVLPGSRTVRHPDNKIARLSRGAALTVWPAIAASPIGAILRAGLTRNGCMMQLWHGGSSSWERVERIVSPLYLEGNETWETGLIAP
ncbi:hypothetical protein SAMN05444172_4279 [Burkholderia sp. GAS332]|jgi:hypothetical protein|nr:hypothetical protein SAMN05444172_4279 [Burkholderia sp. GAS332]